MNRLPIVFHAPKERTTHVLRGASSLSEALIQAWVGTIALLMRPFDARRWIKLSVVCLVLGGGTPTAAFNWTIGILPKDLQVRTWAAAIQATFTRHLGLLIPALTLLLLLSLALLYARAQGRFILVDAVLRREIRIRRTWNQNRWLARSYFFFLLGLLAITGSVFGTMAISSFPYLQSGPSQHSWIFSFALVLILGSVVLMGMFSALAITLTDDFVVPMMYTERLPLTRAWSQLLDRMRKEPAAFAIYVLVRIGLAGLIGAGVLLLLFPILLAIFSGAVFLGSLGLLSLKAIGAVWTWDAATVTLVLAAAAILSGVLLAVLSVVSMPGQVFLQNFAIWFISPRFPSLEQFLAAQNGGEQPTPSPAA